MRFIIPLLIAVLSIQSGMGRTVTPFNDNWNFALNAEISEASELNAAQQAWQTVQVPHDWSIEIGYTQENTACSTGFVQGGMGWYQNQFETPAKLGDDLLFIEFDGVYNHSTCWINGHKLGYRPSGYSSFSYDLTPFLKTDGTSNEITVKVDRTYYVDSRWYTGSGIYRPVRLVQVAPIHIPQWGVRITTPIANELTAELAMKIQVAQHANARKGVNAIINIQDPTGKTVKIENVSVPAEKNAEFSTSIKLNDPSLWSLESPNLYSAIITLQNGEELLDTYTTTFGIRDIQYDANEGFMLNGKSVKFKGVNLHHDAGCVGAAVPSEVWYTRIQKLKDMGCNAVRLSHNPHAPELLKACDKIGMLVMAEAFDEWDVPKEKSVEFLSDNGAPESIAKAYPSVFHEWAKRDLKDLIARDFNHPSVIMWSIGNEIEWTYKYFANAIVWPEDIGDNPANHKDRPSYDMEKIRAKLAENLDGKEDVLTKIAHQLNDWVKEEDTTRWTTCGSVRPSVAFAAGYADAVDLLGFNYRAVEYDIAHETFPEAKFYGSENWTTWNEWQAVKDRDWVGGIFVWTGYAYLGEAGPWPRKGLNLSIFDYTSVQTPRGHMFETMWKEDAPKVFMETQPLEESEFSYTESEGWVWKEHPKAIKKMQWLRRWEWYNMNRHWNYDDQETIIVQAYANTPEVELFLNGETQGVMTVADFEFGAPKWIVPFVEGELKVVGLKNGKAVSEYTIQTASHPTSIELESTVLDTDNDGVSILQVWAQLKDKAGNPVYQDEQQMVFECSDDSVRLLGVDNGSEYNVELPTSGSVKTWEGRAYAVFEIPGGTAPFQVNVKADGIAGEPIEVSVD